MVLVAINTGGTEDGPTVQDHYGNIVVITYGQIGTEIGIFGDYVSGHGVYVNNDGSSGDFGDVYVYNFANIYAGKIDGDGIRAENGSKYGNVTVGNRTPATTYGTGPFEYGNNLGSIYSLSGSGTFDVSSAGRTFDDLNQGSGSFGDPNHFDAATLTITQIPEPSRALLAFLRRGRAQWPLLRRRLV